MVKRFCTSVFVMDNVNGLIALFLLLPSLNFVVPFDSSERQPRLIPAGGNLGLTSGGVRHFYPSSFTGIQHNLESVQDLCIPPPAYPKICVCHNSLHRPLPVLDSLPFPCLQDVSGRGHIPPFPRSLRLQPLPLHI